MKLADIRESGSNHILLMAIKHDEDIKNIRQDESLISIINDELFYLIRLNGVNHFELFRLSQVFRDKLRILNTTPAEVPTLSELREIFPGEGNIIKREENDVTIEDKVPLADSAHFAISSFINLTSQMESDNDIITPGAANLFFPMITRKYDVQIPLSFVDLIESMNDTEIEGLINENYPSTLKDIIDAETHGVKVMISIGFVRLTDIIKYNERYNSLLKDIIYSPLTLDKRNNLYKVMPSSFSKYDKINRGIEKCILYNTGKEQIEKSMKRISRIKNNLEVEFVIQLPIYHMQILLNSLDNTVLPVLYNSSMKNIIDTGLIYEDFKMLDYESDDEDETKIKLEEHEEGISSYRTRITESNQLALNVLPLILKSEKDISNSDAFSILPSIYRSTAVVRYNTEYDYPSIDPVIDSMFMDMKNISSGILEDIAKYK
jgi:hypothetical protein